MLRWKSKRKVEDSAEDGSDEVASTSSSPATPLSRTGRFQPGEDDINWLSERLSEDEASRCEEGMLSRYLRATGGDREHALRRIRDTLDWRARERPHDLHCRACEANPSSHYMHVVGWDRQQRPIIYSAIELATNRSVHDNTEHMLACFESAIRLMPTGAGVESWVWVMDMYGFGFRDCDPRLAHKFFQLAGNYYPERLGHFFVVSPPTAFYTLWKAVYRFIDPVTREKIDFLNFRPGQDNSKVERVFERYFDLATMQWLLDEMAENRQRVVAKHKAYLYSDLSRLVQEPESDEVEAAAEARRLSSSSGRHDHLGSPAFLAGMAAKGPEALPPGLRGASPSTAHGTPRSPAAGPMSCSTGGACGGDGSSGRAVLTGGSDEGGSPQ